MRTDMCIDMHTDMCIYMRMDMYIVLDMRTDMCIDMRPNMCTDVGAGTCVGVRACVQSSCASRGSEAAMRSAAVIHTPVMRSAGGDPYPCVFALRVCAHTPSACIRGL